MRRVLDESLKVQPFTLPRYCRRVGKTVDGLSRPYVNPTTYDRAAYEDTFPFELRCRSAALAQISRHAPELAKIQHR